MIANEVFNLEIYTFIYNRKLLVLFNSYFTFIKSIILLKIFNSNIIYILHIKNICMMLLNTTQTSRLIKFTFLKIKVSLKIYFYKTK